MANKVNQTDLSGVLGNRVALQKVSNRVLATNRPRRRFGPPTEKQVKVQDRFLEAAHYAKLQMADPDATTYYQQGVSDQLKSAYQVALTDYLKKPKVESIDTTNYQGTVGDTIEVFAKAGFMVTGVKVFIRDRKGNLIEKGDAVSGHLHYWNYVATVENSSLSGTTIQAIAYSRPGNKGTMEVTL